MINPDIAFENLSKIYNDFADFCSVRGQVSEADTRIKVIDRILKEVLGWQENNISREGNISRGYYDYCISNNSRNLFTVEAKKEGITFDVPKTLQVKRRYKLSGCLKTSENIKEAIEQAATTLLHRNWHTLCGCFKWLCLVNFSCYA